MYMKLLLCDKNQFVKTENTFITRYATNVENI